MDEEFLSRYKIISDCRISSLHAGKRCFTSLLIVWNNMFQDYVIISRTNKSKKIDWSDYTKVTWYSKRIDITKEFTIENFKTLWDDAISQLKILTIQQEIEKLKKEFE